MTSRLFVVSTPIGNLEDITLRALATLKTVALIAAEDTRRTSNLLRHFGISTPTTSYHEHNERQKRPYLLEKLAAGRDVALVSDAGTPTVADPGQRLIAAAIEQGIQVVAVPGVSAVLTALTMSGLPGDEFIFAGFVPSRSNDRKLWLQRFVGEVRPLIFFETPHRIRATLADMRSIYINRPITIARELTKLHEQVLHTSTGSLEPDTVPEKGEFTIVLGPDSNASALYEVAGNEDVAAYFYQMTNSGLARRPALTQTARKFGLSTKSVYSILEELKGAGPS